MSYNSISRARFVSRFLGSLVRRMLHIFPNTSGAIKHKSVGKDLTIIHIIFHGCFYGQSKAILGGQIMWKT